MTLPDRPVIRSELDPDPLHVPGKEPRPYYDTMPKFETAADVFAYLAARGETLERHEHLPVQDAWDDDRWVCEVPGCRANPARHSHLGAIVIVAAVVGLVILAVALFAAGFRP